jgi:hypothetical protein
VAGTQETLQVHEAARWIRRCAVAVTCAVLLAPAAAAAQQSGTVTETVATRHERDVNGNSNVSEKVVTRRSLTDTDEQVLIEVYEPRVYEGRLMLTRRVRRVTTARSYGAEIIEETEEVNPVALHEPLQMTRRSLTTVRGNESIGYDFERRVFNRDTNGRLVLSMTETEHRSRR